MSGPKTPIRYAGERWGNPDPGRRIDLDSDKAAEVLAAFEADRARKKRPPSAMSPERKQTTKPFNPYRGMGLKRKLSVAEKVEVLWRIEVETRADIADDLRVSRWTIAQIVEDGVPCSGG